MDTVADGIGGGSAGGRDTVPVPSGFVAVAGLVIVWRRRDVESLKPNRVLLAVSALACAFAMVNSALHLALPLWPATPRTINWAERSIVRPELKESFRWLATQLERIPATAHRGAAPQLRTLLEHAELAALQRDVTDWTVTEDLWREWILSPWIEGPQDDMQWRRMLWQHFHPRVRRESNPAAAVEIVARQLALRLQVRDGAPVGDTIREMWAQGTTDQEGFDRLYMATLRSVGVPTRVGDNGRPEFHNGEKWRAAPRPFSTMTAEVKNLP